MILKSPPWKGEGVQYNSVQYSIVQYSTLGLEGVPADDEDELQPGKADAQRGCAPDKVCLPRLLHEQNILEYSCQRTLPKLILIKMDIIGPPNSDPSKGWITS